MGLKARLSRTFFLGRRSRDTPDPVPGDDSAESSLSEDGDVSLLEASLVDASGARELSDRFGGGRRAVDDSDDHFADPSLVVRLQQEEEREELEPPRRRSTTGSEEQAPSLFDMAGGPAGPPPADGSLFGQVKRNRH